MKNNLENAFKDKLSEFEAPYDPQAWEAVKNKLDAKLPGGSSSAWKWIAASAVVATVAITSIVVLNLNENKTNYTDIPSTQENSKSKKEFVENSIDGSAVEEEVISSDTEIIEKDVENNIIESVSSTENAIENETIANNKDLNSKAIKDSDGDDLENNIVTIVEGDEIPNNNVQQDANLNKYKFILGNVNRNEICLGEQISVSNNGAKNEIVRFEVDGQMRELKKAKTFTYTPKSSTVINFKDKDNNIIDTEYIRVNELPNPDFSTETNVFENGLPVTICETFGDYESVTWEFDNKSIKHHGNKIKHHFFKKGIYPITLKVTDFNGCENTKEKEVRIENQYNLMAVDAFKPNCSDHRNKAFMPFSLTQRDVDFTLTIIDPRDNGVIFTSKDSSNPWTGKDERTGKMTDSETVFIWKVQINNPLPNERPVYAGTVVHN